ncbi:MAG: hypothetical protein EB030_04885 [Actinobacteria bacterium]|nr:hypothetical protein [Actinomycetota bacterium]
MELARSSSLPRAVILRESILPIKPVTRVLICQLETSSRHCSSKFLVWKMSKFEFGKIRPSTSILKIPN